MGSVVWQRLKGCRIEAISDYLITEPYGVTDQDEFLNGVLKMRTLLTPGELLVRLHQLEQAANRERIIHWGPRTLDLDILFYDQEIIDMPDLHIPHIDLHNRRFRSCTNESDCSVSATSCVKSDHFAASGQPSEQI